MNLEIQVLFFRLATSENLMKKFSKINLIFLLLIFASGCAYYNTFFNAKKYFNEAEKERKKRIEQEKKQQQQQSATPDRAAMNRASNNEMKKYNDSIKKASKILEIYPKSKYVDDALFILGKCFFWMSEHQKAERKFIELIENFPESKFAPESRLWLGKTYIEMRDYETAEKTFQEILNSKVDDKILDETRLLLGGLFKHKEDFLRAVSEYETAANRAKDKTIRAKSFFEMGECYFELKNYPKAAESFLNARKNSPDDKLEFDAMFQAGLIYEQMNNYDEAIKIFSKLLVDAVNEESWPACRLEIAHCYRSMGDNDEAISWYKDIIERHPKTVEAADAYYYLGEIYVNIKAEYEFAKEYFEKAPTENARALRANEARAMSKSIQRLLALRDDVIQQQKRIASGDSVAAAMEDSLVLLSSDLDTFRITFVDSMFADTSNFNLDSLGIYEDSLRIPLQDSIRLALEDNNLELRKRVLTLLEIAKRKSQNRFEFQFENERQLDQNPTNAKAAIKTGTLGTPEEELIKDKLLLAEIYLFEFNQPDSALSEYLDILEIDTSRKAIPKALYSIGFIAENFKKDTVLADSMFQRLVEEFPDDLFSQHARKQIKKIDVPDPEIEIANKFKDAEKAYIDEQNYKYAMDAFNLIQEEYPSSDFASKSLMAMGWIYENDLGNLDDAYNTYQLLIERYPNSNHAKKVEKKIKEVKKAKSSSDTKEQKTKTFERERDLADTSQQADQDESEEINISTMDKVQYRRYLLTEMKKNDPRRTTSKRW